MSKVVKDEFGDIHVVPSKKEEESGGKRSFFAVRVHFLNRGFADIAYYQEKTDAVRHSRTITRESAKNLRITRIGVVELELITRSD